LGWRATVPVLSDEAAAQPVPLRNDGNRQYRGKQHNHNNNIDPCKIVPMSYQALTALATYARGKDFVRARGEDFDATGIDHLKEACNALQ
jgi:hypothetical protein